ncbi:hypothetical protein TNIN_380571 [Trichonephila inaurata madagascariensis]|uniref:Uncharacterized protein n=1 Tax=Trichonephila inaurata madagascariensis TaxID=2747483 RepID=A0A8X6INX6_9ARAC|nr:hypothetical protein TNIN_380571 [Trichonephila inaurata madagascariensis]
MVIEFWFEVCVYVFYCGISVILENHLSSFYNIFGYVILIETVKYCIFSRLFEKNQLNTATPIVHSVITSKICQYCDAQPPLAALDTEPKLILEHKRKNFIPRVYSDTVFKICGALMIEAVLSPMEKNSNWIGKLNKTSEKKNPPVVRSVVVYKICVALNLSAQLCPGSTSNASIYNKQQKPKTKKKIPKVRSTFIFHICRALDLEAILASP